MQKLILLIVFLSLSFTLFAQNRKILLPDGKLHPINEVKKVKQFNKVVPQTKKINPVNSINGTIDTLEYPGPWDVNFGIFGQDWLLQWFQAPTDLILKKVGFAVVENPDMMEAEVKVVTVNWSKQDLLNAEVLPRGYYEALGNGYNDITAFLDNPERTGGWTPIQPGDTEPFGNDIWSLGGTGFQITPIGNPTEPTYQWVDLSILDEPELLQGEIFGIAIKHTGTNMGQNRIGFWAHQYDPPIPAWKFYANGRPAPGVAVGWWTREFTFNFAAEVDLVGNPGPVIEEFTHLTTTISTQDRIVDAIVSDDSPANVSGVAYVYIYYSTDAGLSWDYTEMTGIEPNYTGFIPGQPPGTEVAYYLEASDVWANITQSQTLEYMIFAPSGASTLVIFNGFDNITGYPQDYYFGPDIQNGLSLFPHDSWSYGALSSEIVNHYNNIFEFSTTGPKDYNDSVITNWLAADGSRNYFLAGQEWLGLKTGFADSTYIAGDFEYDILGITHSYNDVSFAGPNGGQRIPSLVLPVVGTMFGGPLLDLFNTLDPPADSMMYHPDFEIGVDNWIDAFDVETDVKVDMNVETRGIEGIPNVQILPTLSHRTLPTGNKIVFAAFDPLSLNTAVNNDFPYYKWIGFTNENTSYQALQWFGIPVGVELEEKEITPENFRLSQNYPNPFNPSTTIGWQLAVGSRAKIKVYDILGNEIVTLVDEELPAGKYEVEFDASRLPSGVYFYQLRTENFIQTKKMIILR